MTAQGEKIERVRALLWRIEAKCHTETRVHLLELVHEALAAIVDTHRMAETPKDGSVRSMGGDGADRQSPDI